MNFNAPKCVLFEFSIQKFQGLKVSLLVDDSEPTWEGT